MYQQINQISSSKIRSLPPDSSVSEALELMRRDNISCVIVSLAGEPIGVLTERDLIRATDKILAGRNPAIRDLMSQPLISFDADGSTFEALDVMRSNRIRHLVATSKDSAVASVLTLSDILSQAMDACMFTTDSVVNVMSKQVHCVSRGTAVRTVLREMAAQQHSCIVVEENREPVGIVTERDLVWLLTENPDLWATEIDDIMSIPVTTIPPETNPAHAVKLMLNEQLRHLVVVDNSNKIVGLLTQSLLCRALRCP